MLMIRPLQLLAQVVREDLHVAGEHDQFDVLRSHQLQQLRLGLALVSLVTGMWWNGMP